MGIVECHPAIVTDGSFVEADADMVVVFHLLLLSGALCLYRLKINMKQEVTSFKMHKRVF